MCCAHEYRIAIFLSIPLSFGACAPEGVVLTPSGGIAQWVSEQVDKSERLLCTRAEGDDYFFVASIGDQVKVGSRLEVTDNNGRPKAVTIGWLLQNESGDFLVTNKVPTTVNKEYIKINQKWYSENIEYQTLKPFKQKELVASVDINKCEIGTDCPLEGSASRSVKVCP